MYKHQTSVWSPCHTLATWIPKRYVFAIMAMFGIMVSFMMRGCLSIAITQMVNPNSMTDEEDGVFNWDEETQGIILSSFYWGYIITHIPGGILADKFGGKSVFGFSLFFSSVLTLITPWTARHGAYALSGSRLFKGFFEGVIFPSLYNMLAQWTPPCERSIITTITLMGGQIGTLFANVLGGVIMNYNGGNWQNVFYYFGAIGVLCSLGWYLFVYSNPDNHPDISNAEKLYLKKKIGNTQRKKNLSPTPWKLILTSAPVWALIIADLGHHWGLVTVISYLPKYMHDVVKIDSLKNGIYSGLPFLTIFIVSWISSGMSDFMIKRDLVKVAVVRKIYTTISSVGPAVGLICASYSGSNVDNVVAYIIFGMGCMAFSYSSLKVNTLELSPNYSGTLAGLANGAGCIPGMITPYFVGILTTHRTLEEWRMVFFITATALVSSNFIFVIFGSCRKQEWNDEIVTENDGDNNNNNTRNNQSL